MQEKWIWKAQYKKNIITFYRNTNVIELSTLIYYYSTVTLLLLLLLLFIICMEGVYNYIPETMFLGFTITTITTTTTTTTAVTSSSFWLIEYTCQ